MICSWVQGLFLEINVTVQTHSIFLSPTTPIGNHLIKSQWHLLPHGKKRAESAWFCYSPAAAAEGMLLGQWQQLRALFPYHRQVIEGTEVLQRLEAIPTYNERPTVDCKILDCGTFQPWSTVGFPARSEIEHCFLLRLSVTIRIKPLLCTWEWSGIVILTLKSVCRLLKTLLHMYKEILVNMFKCQPLVYE